MIIDGNVLKAEEGKWLTNGDTFGKTVSLGINDSADNWHEITDEESEEITNKEMSNNGEN